jgi:hypothetical protein
MRKIAVLACLLAVLSIMTVGAAASVGLALRANIDFPFYFGNQRLPAGGYVIEMRALQGGTASSVLLRKQDGTAVGLIFTMPAQDQSTTAGQVQFHRYGDTYFLSSVLTRGYQANLKEAKIEKEFRAQLGVGQVITLMAKL